MNTTGVESFEPSRLILARDRAGLTQTVLGEQVGVSARTIKGYEAGSIAPSQQTLRDLARVLGYAEGFFVAAAIEPLPLEAASFRALSKASAKIRNKAVASGAFAVSLLYPFLSERFDLPTVNVPDLREDTPEGAAEALRSHWGLGQRPIPHMVSLLESRGVRVFSLSEDCDAIDAFSIWRDGAPFVFLNTRKTAERSIFDAAHELGHLVIHKHGVPQGHDAENQADRFASHFLLPESAIRADAPRIATVATVAAMKTRWRASTAAIGRRLHDLGLMSDYHYTQFNKYLLQRGRRLEPAPISRETSVVLRKALGTLAEEGLDAKAIASALHLPLAELRALTFGLKSVDGGSSHGSSGRTAPSLRLV
jgi:Zn-dependent peptidase ImmA (M78 family)/DNA-binding XRE family transcriptional regulator